MALVDRGRLKMLAYDWDTARSLLAEGLPMAERFGLDRLRASGFITLGMIPPTEVSSLERGIEIALRLNDVQQIQRGYNNVAEVYWQRGAFAKAEEAYAVARRHTQRLGGGELLRWLDATQAATSYGTGDWDRAIAYLNSFFRHRGAAQPHYLESGARIVRAHIRYARGDIEQALDEAERAAAAGRRGVTAQALVVLQDVALFFVTEGRRQEADELLTMSLAAGDADYHVGLDAALALAELGRFTELADLARRLDLGEHWLAVLRSLAESDYARAADAYGDLGLRTYETRARLQAAERLHEAGDRRGAEEQARAALAFYECVGARRFTARLAAVLPASA
jgi:tetratricopeptide (TPR) repeat protein